MKREIVDQESHGRTFAARAARHQLGKRKNSVHAPEQNRTECWCAGFHDSKAPDILRTRRTSYNGKQTAASITGKPAGPARALRRAIRNNRSDIINTLSD